VNVHVFKAYLFLDGRNSRQTDREASFETKGESSTFITGLAQIWKDLDRELNNDYLSLKLLICHI
jgi:hypothetical protein